MTPLLIPSGAAAVIALVVVAGVLLDTPRTRVRAVLRAERAEAAAEQDAYTLAAAAAYDDMIGAGLLGVTAYRPDPGNPGAVIRLVDDPHHALSDSGRAILVTNPADRSTVAIPVEWWQSDPVTAAAFTYGVTPDQYRQIARRT